MEAWQSAIFYSFLGYILFHLIIDDVAHLIRAYRGQSNTSQRHERSNNSEYDVELAHLLPQMRGQEVASSGVVVGDVGTGVKMAAHQPFMRKYGDSEQRSLVLVMYKICDIILYCLVGYFHTFTTCWCACLTCLDSLISKYIAFLDSMVKSLTAYPAVKYLSATAVSCMALCCVILYILYSLVH